MGGQQNLLWENDLEFGLNALGHLYFSQASRVDKTGEQSWQARRELGLSGSKPGGVKMLQLTSPLKVCVVGQQHWCHWGLVTDGESKAFLRGSPVPTKQIWILTRSLDNPWVCLCLKNADKQVLEYRFCLLSVSMGARLQRQSPDLSSSSTCIASTDQQVEVISFVLILAWSWN